MNIMYKKSVYIIFVSLILGMASNPAAAELVAYYPMNEGSGTLVNDASGNGHDGQQIPNP
jgi:hypothetical protein